MILLLLSLPQAFGWKSVKDHTHNLRTKIQAHTGTIDQNTKETRAEYNKLAKNVVANLKQATNEAKRNKHNAFVIRHSERQS